MQVSHTVYNCIMMIVLSVIVRSDKKKIKKEKSGKKKTVTVHEGRCGMSKAVVECITAESTAWLSSIPQVGSKHLFFLPEPKFGPKSMV